MDITQISHYLGEIIAAGAHQAHQIGIGRKWSFQRHFTGGVGQPFQHIKPHGVLADHPVTGHFIEGARGFGINRNGAEPRHRHVRQLIHIIEQGPEEQTQLRRGRFQKARDVKTGGAEPDAELFHLETAFAVDIAEIAGDHAAGNGAKFFQHLKSDAAGHAGNDFLAGPVLGAVHGFLHRK